MVWHTDRLFRQPRDLETLIDLADNGFVVMSAHGSRDLSDPDDRFILRIEVAHAARSSDDTSRRIKRRFATFRQNGMAHIGGPRRVGWPGRDLTWTPGPGQAEEDPQSLVERERRALVEATAAVLAGVSDAAVAREWNAEGLVSAAGQTWVRLTVKSVLLRPTNAGLIEHGGELVGKISGAPIVDPDDFERLRSMYAARRRGRVAGEVGRRYVGTGILRCGEPGCGAKLSARKGDGFYKDTDVRRSYYTCAKERRGCGKVSADVRSVDRELRTLVVARLSDPRYAAALEAARVMVNARLASVQAEIASCEAVQAGLSERLGRREITLDAFDRANEPLVRDLARLYQERDAMPGGSPHETAESQLPELIEARWDAAEVTERRSMLVQALGRSTLHLDRYQRGPGKQAFDRKRLRLADKEPA